MEDKDFKNKNSDEKEPDKNKISPISLSLELGYIIAIPIVVFGLLGRLIDKKLESTPIFLLAGILLAIISSSIGIYRKMKKIL